MNLSTNVVTHVIVYHDGSRKFITAPQASLVFQASAGVNKSITTPQLGLITFSAIAKIVELEDFYNQYPDERPQYPREEFIPEPRETYKNIEQQSLSDTRRRDGLARGLREEIENFDRLGHPAMNARAILDRWEKREGIVSDTRSYYQKTVDKYKDKERNESEEVHYQHALSKVKEFNVMA